MSVQIFPAADAAYLVRACNAHPALAAENARLREVVEDALTFATRIRTQTDPREDVGVWNHATILRDAARAALAQAGEA